MKIFFKYSEVKFGESVCMKIETMYPFRGISKWESGGLHLNCGNRADWVSHTRAIPPSFNSG